MGLNYSSLPAACEAHPGNVGSVAIKNCAESNILCRIYAKREIAESIEVIAFDDQVVPRTGSRNAEVRNEVKRNNVVVECIVALDFVSFPNQPEARAVAFVPRPQEVE